MPNSSFGTKLSWNSKEVAELTNINGIELSADTIDTTTHQSVDNYKEFEIGLLDAGEVSIEGNFDYTDTEGQHAMLADFASRTKRNVVVTFPSATGATWSFTAGITKIKIGDAPVDGVIKFSASLKVSGKPTFAVAASTGLTTPFFSIDESAVLAPAAAGDKYTYVATVLSTVASVKVTPTAAAGVITVNGVAVTSGEASGSITLGAAGSVTEVVIVVIEANKSPKTYKVYVTRAA